MSLVPWGWNDPFWDRPSRIWDVERPSKFWDIDRPSRYWDIDWPPRVRDIDDWWSRDIRSLFKLPDYVRKSLPLPFQDLDSGAKVNYDKDKFEVNVDVQQFAPHEITVKTSGNTITVEGKHEEKQNGNAFVSNNFIRRYVLPQGHDVNQAVSNLSSDGILTITAPRIDRPSIGERSLPILKTGRPARAIEHKK